MKEWNIRLIHSPPYSPSSNGAVERAVRLLKDALKKNKPSTSIDEILFRYRATPLESGRSPAQLLCSMSPKTKLDLLNPLCTNSGQHEAVECKFKVGSKVWARNYRSKSKNGLKPL
ncbi:Uncharacterised protein r2_g2884 [Pycnogonum litorale]